jgi:Flp pilus assembly pilin Flp
MFVQFLRDEEGQTTVEYLLIIAVIVVVVAVMGKNLQIQVPILIGSIFKGLNTAVSGMMSKAQQ